MIERHRGRKVHLFPREFPVLAPHGLWVAGPNSDYIFYDDTFGLLRQRQIIGHEFGHLLFDNGGSPADTREIVAMLLPDVTSDLVIALQQRTGYADLAERRAEVFGTVALQRMESWSALRAQNVDSAVLARLTATLGGETHR